MRQLLSFLTIALLFAACTADSEQRELVTNKLEEATQKLDREQQRLEELFGNGEQLADRFADLSDEEAERIQTALFTTIRRIAEERARVLEELGRHLLKQHDDQEALEAELDKQLDLLEKNLEESSRELEELIQQLEN